MRTLKTSFLAISIIFTGCATSQPQQGSTIAPGAKRVGTKSLGAAPCDESHEWGHDGADPEVRAALDQHFAQRPNDEITSFHVLQEPTSTYPRASQDNPVVTYRFRREGAVVVERAVVKRGADGGWQVSSIAWSCEPQE